MSICCSPSLTLRRVQVTSAASFPAPAFPGLHPSQFWVPPAGHGPTTVPAEARSRSRPPFQFALCALECAVPRHVSLQGQEPWPGTAERGALGKRWQPLAPLLCPGTALGVRVALQPLPRAVGPGGSPARVSPQSLGFVLGAARAGPAPHRPLFLQPGC